MNSTKRGLAMVALTVVVVGGLAIWVGVSRPGDGTHDAVAATGPKRDPECGDVVHSLEAMRAAVERAGEGEVVCLAAGAYGELKLSGPLTGASRVTVRAEDPGKSILDGADLGRSRVTLARFVISGEVNVEPGTVGVTIAHNRVTGGYLGVDAGPTTTTTVNDVAIVGNKFIGPFGEDAIRLNRYHDANGDGVGALVANNEFTNIRENGNHSDCLQTVWVGDHLVYRGNYLHDNRCQGFFVKDQARPVRGVRIEDNLLLHNDAPCPPGVDDCGTPSDMQIFGPYSGLVMRRNTIWGNGANASFQEADGARPRIEANVIYKLWTSTDLSAARVRDNTRCLRESSGGLWPRSAAAGETVTCAPGFRAPRLDDYRVRGDRGVTWAPSERHFGP